MGQLQLLDVDNRNIPLPHFPTPTAAVIFRGWELLPAQEIASLLKTSTDMVTQMARRMGLGEQPDVSGWKQKGYITVLKRFWHLLPYEQILELLGWDEDRLAYVLKEDDFLGMKLGGFKPQCDRVIWREPSAEEWVSIDRIGEVMRQYFPPEKQTLCRKPFDFFTDGYLQPAGRKHSVIVDGWCIVDDSDLADTQSYIRDFVEDFFAVWGVRLKTGKAEKNSILLCRSADLGAEESHRLTVSADRIVIEADSGSGFLRGLQFLLQADSLQFGVFERRPRFKTRMIYSFCGLYANALDEDTAVSYPDELLRRYSRLGINAVWLQGVLYKLQPYPFAPELAQGWEERLENLRRLVRRAKRYGISVYLYMNEPRAMPLSFFAQYPELKGHQEGENASLCISDPRVTAYLGGAVESLCRAVPELGGFFLITMSENLTHCCSHTCWPEAAQTNCPHCIDRRPLHVMTDVIRTFSDAVARAGTGARLWAWTWGWEQQFLSEETIEDTFRALPADVTVMAVSETGVPYTIGGVSGTVSDYSMSVIGPGEIAKRVWTAAESHGLECAAKIQINTTWECSTIPALPVYDLVRAHIDKLSEAHVQSLLLSWTLGGYPSENIRMVSDLFFEIDAPQVPTLSAGSVVSAVEKQAATIFSEAFREFPFHISTLYRGPQNGGPSNLLFERSTGFASTMTGFAYDDLEEWRANYPQDVFAEQFRKLSEKWAEGLALLDEAPRTECRDFASAGYILFRSCYNQVRHVLLRDDPQANREELQALLQDEIRLAIWMADVMSHNPSVGYEAANHYYFTHGMMMEKVVNCAWLAERVAEVN